MGQQIATFEELYPHMAQDGVFLIEEVHTSYRKYYGGGYRDRARRRVRQGLGRPGQRVALA